MTYTSSGADPAALFFKKKKLILRICACINIANYYFIIFIKFACMRHQALKFSNACARCHAHGTARARLLVIDITFGL